MVRNRELKWLVAAIACWIICLFILIASSGCEMFWPEKKPVMVTGEQVEAPSGWVEYQRREK